MKFKEGRIGDIVYLKSNDLYGFISGITRNSVQEPIFIVTWENEQVWSNTIHPDNLIKISK